MPGEQYVERGKLNELHSRPATSLGYSSQTGDTAQSGTFEEGLSGLVVCAAYRLTVTIVISSKPNDTAQSD